MSKSTTQLIHGLIGCPDPSKDRGVSEMKGSCLVYGSTYDKSRTDTTMQGPTPHNVGPNVGLLGRCGTWRKFFPFILTFILDH